MAGQTEWKDAGSGVNDFIVKEQVAKGVYYAAMASGVWGNINEMRNVDPIEIVAGGGKTTIGSGKDSPVHEKSLKENNTALFTMMEEYKGMPTYGDADVRPGDFPTFKHGRIEARTISSPGFPVWGYESMDNFKRVMTSEEVVSNTRNQVSKWMGREFDLEGFRSMCCGLSRNLWDTQDGGKQTELDGTTATVRTRVPLNTYVAGASDPTATAWSAETHNNNLATALAGITQDETSNFNFETHLVITRLIDKYGMRPVKYRGREYRAIALQDPRNAYALRRDEEIVKRWMFATERSEDNRSLNSRGIVVLDDILYLPVQIMPWFSPTVTPSAQSGNRIRFGCDMIQDPRDSNFVNNSNITMTMVLGAGAQRRGRRFSELRYTTETGRHGKGGPEVAVHWDDGWMRNEWFSKDGRNEMFCDSSFTVFNWDDMDW